MTSATARKQHGRARTTRRSGTPGRFGLALVAGIAGSACPPASAAEPSPAAAAVGKDCAQCPEMVVLPAGTFLMGSSSAEPGHSAHEAPLHEVTFARPFAIGKYEVTFDEWYACVADGGCAPVEDAGWGRGRRPVLFVSFEMAVGYTRWLSGKTGQSYRLPSEAEWEYAARGGTATPWSWGDEPARACEFGNVGDDALREVRPDWSLHHCNDGYARTTAPVGSFRPNGFGLHDMAGNAWEWVEDCYNPDYRGAPADGSAWLSGDCVRRVVRGGGWYNDPQAVRPAMRYAGDDPGRQNNTLGFRVVRALP